MREPPVTRAKAIAERVARSVADQGARAVALVGSYARGDATAESDVDLAVIGDGPHYRLELHDGLLVSLGWATAEEQRRRLYDPDYLGTHVPGWRTAIAVYDPEALAAATRQEARAWVWRQVEVRCDEWVADSFTGYAEEVQKLAASIKDGERTTASVQRSLLALRLAPVMALKRRLLYNSENQLWNILAGELGAAWTKAQSDALGLGGESFEASCTAALRLFALAADEVRPLLDERQLAVVEHALRRAETVTALLS
jgi:predicted nucleotidyltransferase